MRTGPTPLTREVVLIGGGHTHALVLRRWGMRPVPGARLTVINPGPTAPYTGMLPGLVAGHYRQEELEIDLVRLARFAGARLILGRAEAIDTRARTVRIADRGEIAYDVASVDIGITSDMPDLPGFAEHGVAAKPLGDFAARWQGFLDAGGGPVAVIGGGAAGIELALSMDHALRTAGIAPEVTVIEAARALSALPLRTRRLFLRELAAAGIGLREATRVARIEPGRVVLEDGGEVPARLTVGAAGARPHRWLGQTGLELERGFLRVDRWLRTSDPGVFAVGDCAHLSHAPRPKAGVFAVRAAPVLYANLRAEVTGSARRAFAPQRDFLKLISLGRKAAVLDRSGIALKGDWVWRWKDRIDRRFMERLGDLPAMPAPEPPPGAARGVRDAMGRVPHCAGCGAKVGGGALASALAGLPALARADVEARPGDDAAVLTLGGTKQVITTDHLRAFTEDPWLMGRIAAEHAMGDVWAMGAAPQAALATVILPRMTEAMQTAWLKEIMAGAATAFGAAGAEIAGGHTTLGTELTVGFTVTGLLPGPPVSLDGARPGDALILTRPIGSGTILAAEMRLAARGDWVAAALDEMARSQGAAGALLAGAHAMTDVTGFGLAGHLLNILDASGVGARLWLDRVPVYAGAEALAEAGIRSTLYPANRDQGTRVAAPDTARGALLYDPQTAGGLLAAVEAGAAEGLLNALKDKGYTAAIIGEILDGPPLAEVL